MQTTITTIEEFDSFVKEAVDRGDLTPRESKILTRDRNVLNSCCNTPRHYNVIKLSVEKGNLVLDMDS